MMRAAVRRRLEALERVSSARVDERTFDRLGAALRGEVSLDEQRRILAETEGAAAQHRYVAHLRDLLVIGIEEDGGGGGADGETA